MFNSSTTNSLKNTTYFQEKENHNEMEIPVTCCKVKKKHGFSSYKHSKLPRQIYYASVLWELENKTWCWVFQKLVTRAS